MAVLDSGILFDFAVTAHPPDLVGRWAERMSNMENAPSVSARASGARPGGGAKSSPKGGAKVGLLEALETILADESSLYLSLGPEVAVVGLNMSPKYHASGGSMEASRWVFMTPRERAMWVVGELHKVAAYARRPRIRTVPTPPNPLRRAAAS